MSSVLDKIKNAATGKPKILFILTSHNLLGNTGKPTGWYLPEFAHPYYRFAKHTDITIASPKGGEAPLDPGSIEPFKDDAESTRFLNEQSKLWKSTEKLSDYIGKADQFDAVFVVGGHGPMFDLAIDPQSQQLLAEFYEKGKVVAAVCHGPAALVNVKLTDGSYLIDGSEVTSFTNDEEDQVKASDAMPFMLETQLGKNGATFVKAEPWGEKVVQSGSAGKLMTGQNPASAGPLAEAVLAVITS